MRVVIILFIFSLRFATPAEADERPSIMYAGSFSCRECHEKFYQLWTTSMHGLAMQPYTPEFAKARLTPQQDTITINKINYRASINEGVVTETDPQGTKKYKIAQVLGGKNVFYFLTLLDKGRLQTLPVAYDLNKREWLDTAASGMRHFPGGERGQAVNWKDSAYTFNTACYGCHVSQLSTNYDPKADAYHTVWGEPGINCETCHGPSAKHIKLAKAAPKGAPMAELGLISTKAMTAQQRNDSCLSCHSKGSPLSLEYKPGEPFYDHFDLVTLEDADYYPDGRDLGENYTNTTWSQSPCVKGGKLDCMHCHTSSGRYRFAKENFNGACLPCHADKVSNPEAHTHHMANGVAGKCIACHMPMTDFARMNRTDHSMRPPAPATTLAFKSPNACNLCHREKDAAWADKFVRQWHARDYQAPVLMRAALIEAGRKRDWTHLPEMLTYIQSAQHDEVFTASLIRLMQSATDERITPVLLTAMKDPSPLVRAAAAEAIAIQPSREGVQALLDATGDATRLVRTRAAAGLAGFPLDQLTGEVKIKVEKANQEYLTFIMARPDQWTSHYNLGNVQLSRGELKEAVASYQDALKKEPQAIMAMVNSSIAYAQMGENVKAEKSLNEALKIAPENAAANFNMGLLKAEQNDPGAAQRYLKNALTADPQMAQAAYNLAIIVSKDNLNEAVNWCRKAAQLKPRDPKYAYTLAFFLNQKGARDEALRTLKALIAKYPEYKDAVMLLQEISRKGIQP
jgi:tetratricopeptide (TPR) repeat protein